MSAHQNALITARLKFHEEDHRHERYSNKVDPAQLEKAMRILVKAHDLEHEASLRRSEAENGDNEARSRADHLQNEINALWIEGAQGLVAGLGILWEQWNQGVARGAVPYSMRTIPPSFFGTLAIGIPLLVIAKSGWQRFAGTSGSVAAQLVILGAVVPLVYSLMVMVGVTGFDKSGIWFTNLAQLLGTPMFRELSPGLAKTIADSQAALEAFEQSDSAQRYALIAELSKSAAALGEGIHQSEMRGDLNRIYQEGFGMTGAVNGARALFIIGISLYSNFNPLLAWSLLCAATVTQFLAAIPAGIPDKKREQSLMVNYVARHLAYTYRDKFGATSPPLDPEAILAIVPYMMQHFRNAVTTTRGAVSEPIKKDLRAVTADIAKLIGMDPKVTSVLLALRHYNYNSKELPERVVDYMIDRLQVACADSETLRDVTDIETWISDRAANIDTFNTLMANPDAPTVEASATEAEKEFDQLARAVYANLAEDCIEFSGRVDRVFAQAETDGGAPKLDKLENLLWQYDAAFSDLPKISDGSYSEISPAYRQRLSIELEIPDLSKSAWGELARIFNPSIRPEHRRALRQAWARTQAMEEFVSAFAASVCAYWQLYGLVGENFPVVSGDVAKVVEELWALVKHESFPAHTRQKIAFGLVGIQLLAFLKTALDNYHIVTAIPGRLISLIMMLNVGAGPKGATAMGMSVNFLLSLRNLHRRIARSTLPGTGFSDVGFAKNFWGSQLASTIWAGIAILHTEAAFARKVRRLHPAAHQQLEHIRRALEEVNRTLPAPQEAGSPEPDDQVAPTMFGALPPPDEDEDTGQLHKGPGGQVAPTMSGAFPAPDEDEENGEVPTPPAAPVDGRSRRGSEGSSHAPKTGDARTNATLATPPDKDIPGPASEEAVRPPARRNPFAGRAESPERPAGTMGPDVWAAGMRPETILPELRAGLVDGFADDVLRSLDLLSTLEETTPRDSGRVEYAPPGSPMLRPAPRDGHGRGKWRKLRNIVGGRPKTGGVAAVPEEPPTLPTIEELMRTRSHTPQPAPEARAATGSSPGRRPRNVLRKKNPASPAPASGTATPAASGARPGAKTRLENIFRNGSGGGEQLGAGKSAKRIFGRKGPKMTA